MISVDKKKIFKNCKSPVARNKTTLLKEEVKKRKVKSYTDIRNLDLDELDEKNHLKKSILKL